VKFNGKTSPDAADQWLKDLERIFDAKMCPTGNRLAFAVYMLTEEAEHWWISMKSIMEERGEHVTWEAFRGKFLSEYFPDTVRYAKEVEFLQLTQGGKSVTELLRSSSTSAVSTHCPLMRSGGAENLRTTSGEISA